MAYAALVSSVELLKQIAQQDQRGVLSPDEQCNVELLCEKFCFLLAFLEDDPPIGGEGIDQLERRIRDAAYQAQDIIETYVSNLVSPGKDCCGIKRAAMELISKVKESKAMMPYMKLSLHNVEREDELELENVMEEEDFIVEEVMKINKSHADDHLHHSEAVDTSESAPPVVGNTLIGFDEMQMELKAQLCGEPSKLEVISIVGMGGIGKTTLAKSIFDDSLIVYHFDICAWITISQDYHVRKLLLRLLDSTNMITTKELVEAGEEVLESNVWKILKGRRYLIVLDDVWSTKAWDDLKRIFPDDCNGSRVMITTRILDVAAYADSCGPLHQMKLMDEDQSWNLLRKKVFAQDHCPPELKYIGREISNSCQGLPLAIVTVAGLLIQADRKPSEWNEVARNISSLVMTSNEHFSKILSLSYDHLPHHLKACFLYMGGFPEDYEINVSKLMKLWIAEGFVKPVRSKSLEEVAQEHLEDLVKRNLVLATKKRSNGKLRLCGIHDLLRDLCRQRAQDKNFLHVMDINSQFTVHGMKNNRHLFLHQSLWREFNKIKAANPCLRSVVCLMDDAYHHLSYILGFKLLRVLDALDIYGPLQVDQIVELIHLRYFAINQCYVYKRRLPPSISKLQNLQTLILGSSIAIPGSFLTSLPSQIWKMPQLRHLIFPQINLSPPPLAARILGQVPVLENLQTLSTLQNFRFIDKAIEMIPNIKKLKVEYIHKSTANSSKYCFNNLVHLHQLETLNIRFHIHNHWWNDTFPKSFVFPLNLRKLSLEGCAIPWKDLTIVGSLPKLEVLKLRLFAFIGEEWESVEGEFLQLKFLLIESLYLKYWRAESTHFPSLKHLRLKNCEKLEEIPCGIGEITSLDLIEVYYSSKSVADSAMLILEEQRSQGNEVLQVHVHS